MVQSCLGVLSMARCSSTTSANLSFPVSFPLYIPFQFLFSKRKEKMFQKKKTEEKRGSNMLKSWTSNVQRIGSNMLKTWAKESKTTGPNMLKIWTNKEERRISSNMPKTRAEMKKRTASNMLKTWVTKRKKDTSSFRFQAFKVLFHFSASFCPCATVFMPWIYSILDCLILVWLFLNLCCGI